MIEDLRGLGKTVLLTTHYMDEAQKVGLKQEQRARGLGEHLAVELNA